MKPWPVVTTWGPLHGIPVAVKDQVKSKGIRTTAGSPILNDFVPDEDATVLANLKYAGAVLLGKLNMTEFGTTGFSHQFETPRNPWDTERYTGGSSSGSGAATAGFLCATSLGEDTGGSVRFPAAWCGLVGMRPTWGRVSRYGVMPGVWSMDAIGPLSRTVEDCALTFGAIAGHDPNDRYTSTRPVPDYVQALNGEIKGLRVGILRELIDDEGVDAEVREAVRTAAGVLGELGAAVKEVSIPMAAHSLAISGALRVEAPTNYRDFVKNRLQEIGHDNRIGYLLGSILPAQAFYKAQKLRSILRQQTLEALEEVDLLVTPTTRVAAQPVAPDPVVDSKDRSIRSQILGSAGAAHNRLQPCQHSRGQHLLRLHIAGQSAHRPADRGKALRRRDTLQGGPRLRAGYSLAHSQAADIGSTGSLAGNSPRNNPRYRRRPAAALFDAGVEAHPCAYLEGNRAARMSTTILAASPTVSSAES